MFYTEIKIVEKAVSLSGIHGCLESVDGIYGKVCVMKLDDVEIVYSTPFSGAEVLPSVKHYLVSIWKGNKKIFDGDYSCLTSLDSAKSINRKLVKDFMQLI